MYMDAEERKNELMRKNKMKGLMFKMDADPRVIGSGPDGRGTASAGLSGRPRWMNSPVLECAQRRYEPGGTRPPTEDEWKQYKYYHRARLAINPDSPVCGR